MSHNYHLQLRAFQKKTEFAFSGSKFLRQAGRTIGILIAIASCFAFLLSLCGAAIAALVVLISLEKIWGWKLRDIPGL